MGGSAYLKPLLAITTSSTTQVVRLKTFYEAEHDKTPHDSSSGASVIHLSAVAFEWQALGHQSSSFLGSDRLVI